MKQTLKLPAPYPWNTDAPILPPVRGLRKFIALGCLALAVGATGAFAGDRQLSPELQSCERMGDVEVIVRYRTIPNEAHHRPGDVPVQVFPPRARVCREATDKRW